MVVDGAAAFPSGAVRLAHSTHRQLHPEGHNSLFTFLCSTVSYLSTLSLFLEPRNALSNKLIASVRQNFLESTSKTCSGYFFFFQ
jgi:hypothetical protein